MSIHGIWFDETGVEKSNGIEFRQLTDHARASRHRYKPGIDPGVAPYSAAPGPKAAMAVPEFHNPPEATNAKVTRRPSMARVIGGR
ncbi:Spherulation-specific family 4-domain-containing protein [Apiospora rasikravindrae]|uniref:Spherulation-specific family 4-domain-containing protein n=1 Tax=Apiospora rasikravindrae TaxID=990691 RepID=A0ABR1SKR8_9PEZI